jgi:hypothetical protein
VDGHNKIGACIRQKGKAEEGKRGISMYSTVKDACEAVEGTVIFLRGMRERDKKDRIG